MFRSAPDALVATIAFFDFFDLPLTSFEAWAFLFQYDAPAVSLGELETMLSRDQRLVSTDGYWMLIGREGIARTRQARSAAVHQKWEITRRASVLASRIPFLKLFAVCNTMGYGVAKEESDVDVFVVAGPGRVWTTRLLLTALLHLARLRRHGSQIRSRICLSFYVTTDALSMVPLALDDGSDPYLAWWVGSVVPLVDRGAYADFITANRPFVERYRQQFPLRERPPIAVNHGAWGMGHGTRTVFEWILAGWVGDLAESLVRLLQYKKIKRSSHGKTRENRTAVVVSDHVLKFHEHDRRRALRDQWLRRVEELATPTAVGGFRPGGRIKNNE